jgi:hypothetical protein
MSFYQTTPFKSSPKLLVQGTPEFLLGQQNSNTGPTLAYVLSNSATGTVATVVVRIYSGNIPTPNGQITIVGSSNSAGGFNVVNSPILSVSAPAAPDTGIYSITFASAVAAQASTPDSGMAQMPQPEVGDPLTAVTSTPVSSVPVCSPVSGPNSVGKSLSVTVTLPASTAANPSTLSAVTVTLQGANRDFDSDYNTVATLTPTGVAAGSTTDWQSGQGDPTAPSNSLAAGNVTLLNFRFYRVQVTAATGAGPIITKIMQ